MLFEWSDLAFLGNEGLLSNNPYGSTTGRGAGVGSTCWAQVIDGGALIA